MGRDVQTGQENSTYAGLALCYCSGEDGVGGVGVQGAEQKMEMSSKNLQEPGNQLGCTGFNPAPFCQHWLRKPFNGD